MSKLQNKCIENDTKAAARQSPNCIRKTKNKIRQKKRLSIWPMEFFHPAMWHCGMTCHWIRPNVRHIGILLSILISTISPQSTCHSAPLCEILSKSDRLWQKKMTSCRFSKWRISAILDFMGPIMGSLKSPCTTSCRSSIETVALNC